MKIRLDLHHKSGVAMRSVVGNAMGKGVFSVNTIRTRMHASVVILSDRKPDHQASSSPFSVSRHP